MPPSFTTTTPEYALNDAQREVLAYLETLPSGSLVHFDRRGRGRRPLQAERASVTRDDLGRIRLRSVAMIGAWRAPYRSDTGLIRYAGDNGFYGLETADGGKVHLPATWQRVLHGVELPVQSRLLEVTDQSQAREAAGAVAVELQLPAMSEEEARLAWDKLLANTISSLPQVRIFNSDFMDAASGLVAARATPWPLGQPTSAKPDYQEFLRPFFAKADLSD